MKKLFAFLSAIFILAACNNKNTTEETNKSDSSAVRTVDSLKTKMDILEDSAKRAADSAAIRK